KAFGSGNIAAFAQQEVHRTTLLVHRSIQIGPASLRLYIGLVTARGPAHRSCVLIPPVFQKPARTVAPTAEEAEKKFAPRRQSANSSRCCVPGRDLSLSRPPSQRCWKRKGGLAEQFFVLYLCSRCCYQQTRFRCEV